MSAILGKSVYLDQGVYLHALPAGITIGDDTFIIHQLLVFHFRNLPQVEKNFLTNSKCVSDEYAHRKNESPSKD